MTSNMEKNWKEKLLERSRDRIAETYRRAASVDIEAFLKTSFIGHVGKDILSHAKRKYEFRSSFKQIKLRQFVSRLRMGRLGYLFLLCAALGTLTVPLMFQDRLPQQVDPEFERAMNIQQHAERGMDESFTESMKLGKEKNLLFEEGKTSLEISGNKPNLAPDKKETLEDDVSSGGETTTMLISKDVKLPDVVQQRRNSVQLESELSEGHDASTREADISISKERTSRQQKATPSRHKRHKFKRGRNLDPFHALMSSAGTVSSNMSPPLPRSTVDVVGSPDGFTEAFDEVLKLASEANKTAGEKPAELQEGSSMAELLTIDKSVELDKASQKLSKEKNESSENKDTLASVGPASKEQNRDVSVGGNNDALREVHHNTLQTDSTLSQKVEIATEIPIFDSLKENDKSRNDNPLQSKENVPESEAIVDSVDSNVSKAVVDESKTRAEETKTMTDESKAMVDETKTVADESKAGADESKAGADETKTGANETKTGTDETKTVADESRAGADETKTMIDESKLRVDETKIGTDEAKAGADETKTGTDETKTVADESKAGADETKTGADEAKAGADESKAEADETKTGTDEAKAGPDETKTMTDETKAMADELKAVVDESKTGADESKVVADESKAEADESKAGADVNAVFSGEKPDDRIVGEQVLQAGVHQKDSDDWPQEFALISSLKQRAVSSTLKVGLLNMEAVDLQRWQSLAGEMPIIIPFESVNEKVGWNDLYPEWIDEEERYGTPECPSIPLPNVSQEVKLDVVVARAPCTTSSILQEGWKHPSSLQALLGAASLAVKAGNKNAYVLILSECRPLVNLFTCGELLEHRDQGWLYQVNLEQLEKRISLPIGSCQLSVSLRQQDTSFDTGARKDAYATVLHSGPDYVCGAIATAHSIRKTGSTKDLVILVDNSILPEHRQALHEAGWKVRDFERIYKSSTVGGNQYEKDFSKFRLWQLTDYKKVVYVEADVLVLRNLDHLFMMPEVSGSGSAKTLFNSGVMVIEPSNCTFQLLMDEIEKVASQIGGDWDFLNRMFPWWHRIPRQMNYLKYFWTRQNDEVEYMSRLFSSDPLSCTQSIIGDISLGNVLETMTATGMPTSSLQAMKLITNGLRCMMTCHGIYRSTVHYLRAQKHSLNIKGGQLRLQRFQISTGLLTLPIQD